MEVVAWKNGVRRDEPNFIDALTDIDVDIGIAGAVFVNKSIAKNRSDIRCETEAQLFAQSGSFQATGEIEVIGQGK